MLRIMKQKNDMYKIVCYFFDRSTGKEQFAWSAENLDEGRLLEFLEGADYHDDDVEYAFEKLDYSFRPVEFEEDGKVKAVSQ